ncbi:polyphosphate kinase 2 family protein [Glaciimonas sp. CA11.2]|uniref:PPK2 family polyphosphate kinase n=1 Tax=unclassified Glaciimonas TaxID=2644401 RepID=UPI002AB4501B|nr:MULTISPECIES: PPK2 family polyphosphate kinase [unclassified Glaciimonas]MDY7546080.1 polyphosphate kinase 2 family protein [Glaciimonas sp. CA11.2]MEB0012070.1 polyphosphate kinase 2 family protein [Glaciimonas sp. Cout2]MEB0084269.1 polyphosphate kinase 2 family protein [Glaciimonas sp. Gout2]MEB0162024.1 polyphosphate kinase 2 family protein [Glaciimonas sp. CA11.2]
MSAQSEFRAGKKTKLKDGDASKKPLSSGDKDKDKQKILSLATEIGLQQDLLYAGQHHKLLVVLQGIDTSGKDGTVKGVFSEVNPEGINIVSFKAPSPIEKAHDYLWRVHQQVPPSGEIAVFNRSHYEDVLITRVHDWIDDAECERRYTHIRDFERMLSETGTTIIKFLLHISKDEQASRLQERIDDPAKNWKFDLQDMEERKSWDTYQDLFSRAIQATDADHAPWYVIPANSKTHRNVAIASIVLETLQTLKLKPPAANPALVGLKIV